MTTFENEIREAEADLAFALAQGDGYREDEAAARVARLRAELAAYISQCEARGRALANTEEELREAREGWDGWQAQALAAEAQRDTLAEALRMIADARSVTSPGVLRTWARVALSAVPLLLNTEQELLRKAAAVLLSVEAADDYVTRLARRLSEDIHYFLTCAREES